MEDTVHNPEAEATRRFYDGLAADYHLVYGSWDAAITNQSDVLRGMLEERGAAPPARVWDCTCGIGTQSLGLAGLGYRVTASDLSPASVDRARLEASQRHLSLDLAVHDIRQPPPWVNCFDAAISCDNALPHLLADADLRQALTGLAAALRPGAVLAVGIRDYDALADAWTAGAPPSGTPPVWRHTPDGQAVVFQMWDWDGDGRRYQTHLFVLRRRAGGVWTTSEYTSTYRVLRRQELSDLAGECGFSSVRWLMPEETGALQPIMVASRP